MDACTLCFIGTWTVIFIAVGVAAYLCQKWENYIRDNKKKKK